jgi:hypothetical protein
MSPRVILDVLNSPQLEKFHLVLLKFQHLNLRSFESMIMTTVRMIAMEELFLGTIKFDATVTKVSTLPWCKLHHVIASGTRSGAWNVLRLCKFKHRCCNQLLPRLQLQSFEISDLVTKTSECIKQEQVSWHTECDCFQNKNRRLECPALSRVNTSLLQSPAAEVSASKL